MKDNCKKVIIAAMILLTLSSCNDEGSNQSLQLNPGDEVVLVNDIGIETYKSGCNVPVCISPDVLEKFYWAVKDGNGNEIFQLHMDGLTLNIDCNVQARIETLYYEMGYKVYVLEGQQYGKEFWVYYENVKQQ